MRLIRIIALLIIASLCACKTTEPLAAYKGLSDQQIYQRAENNLQKGRYEEAVKDFEALDNLYPFGDYSQQGQRDIIDAYYKSADNESALDAADRYIRLYPRADDVDYAYYMKGVVNKGPAEPWYENWLHADPAVRDVSKQEGALTDFDTFIERFPNSKYVPKAQTAIAELQSLLAQHTLEIAKFYLRHKTYIAAANRAAEIVQNYPITPQVPAALNVMIQSYRALNEPDMANNALRTLVNKYPNSKEAGLYASAG